MIRSLLTATALAAVAFGGAPALADSPRSAAKARPNAPFSSPPVFIRTSEVYAAPPSDTDGETFPGQLAMAAPDPGPPPSIADAPVRRPAARPAAKAAAKPAAKTPAKPAAKPPVKVAAKPAPKAAARPKAAATRLADSRPAVLIRASQPVAAELAAAPDAGLAMSDWRELDPGNALVIETTRGRVIVELLPEAAPGHVQRIKELAHNGFYDGLVFFRVIDRFMAQTGDPQNTGEGESEQPDLPAEFTFRRTPETPFVAAAKPMGLEVGFIRSAPIVSQDSTYFASTGDQKVSAWGTYCPGVAGMARDEPPDSANSQFFIMRYAYPSLDKRYTIWGRAVTGLDAVRAIKTGEPVQDPDKMVRVRVLADIPEAERPRVRVIDTASDGFRRLVQRVRQARGADFSVCDVELPVQVTEPPPLAAPPSAPPAPQASSAPAWGGNGPVM